MPVLNDDQLRMFAEQGYLLVPGAVSPDLITAARREVAAALAETPPAAGTTGPHFIWRNDPAADDPLLATLTRSGASAMVEQMLAPIGLESPRQVQVSLNIPVFRHRPGGPHIDGLHPLPAEQRPYTFSLLAGVFLTGQTERNMGNLWVWPGSHQQHAAHLRKHGAEAIRGMAHPALHYRREPVQVLGQVGDLLLAHYLLGHNIGGNTSEATREVLYFRLSANGHAARWTETVQDPLLEFAPVRAVL